jgi:hypothetical protein
MLIAITAAEVGANQDQCKCEHHRADQPGNEDAALPWFAQDDVTLADLLCRVDWRAPLLLAACLLSCEVSRIVGHSHNPRDGGS